MSDQQQLADLIRQLRRIESRIVELAGGNVDAVVDAEGTTILLQHAQQHLQERAADYREFAQTRSAILNALPAHIALLDGRGQVVEVNDAWRRYGRDHGLESDSIGTNYLDICEQARGSSAEEAADVARAICAILAGQSDHYSLEYPCHGPDEQRWFRIMAAPLATAQDRGAVIMHVDVTEQKLVEEALRAREADLAVNEERFRVLARATMDTVWDWNLTTDEIWWNEGMQAHFGHAIEDLEPDSRSWTSRIHPEDLDDVLDSIHTCLHGRQVDWEAQYRFRRADGTYAHVVDRGCVFRDADETATRMVGGLTDVTERISLEEQLRQAQRLEAVGQLTGGVAHDFNNLLTVILGNADLLTEQLEERSISPEMVTMIRSAAEQGAELTRRLLAFARRQPLDPRPTDLNQLAADIDGLLRRTLGEHIELEISRGGGLWHAMIDPPQLESTLLNLAINARDAMPQGGRLTIETANARLDSEYAAHQIDVKPGQYVMLAVSDTGSGIPDEVAARVFEPFFTTKEKGQGSGLGLAMVYGFIKQSGGHVRIYSEAGEGTTVRLYLPRSTTASANTQAPVVAPDARAAGEKILLVEDDTAVRQLTRHLLEALGYRVLEAANGPAAQAILEGSEPIDLLFTDIVMPGGMSGRQLADTAETIRPGIKVLYASGYSENAIVHHGRLDPGVHLLAKPYRRADLARMVRIALEDG